MTARRVLPVLLATLLALGLARVAGGTTASNRRAAERDVATLLRRFVPPAGLKPLESIPPKAGWWLRSRYVIPHHAADAYHLWRIDSSERSVVAFVRAHRPLGANLHLDNSTARTTQTLPSHHFVFDFPARPGQIWTRQLYVTVVPLRKRVMALRVDAQDQWVWTQTARDRLPGGVREVDVTRVRWATHPPLVVRVRKLREIRRITGWAGGLYVVPPRTGCPVEGPISAPSLIVSFRGADGLRLARIEIRENAIGPAPACQAMAYTVRGHTRDALVAGDFPRNVSRLVGLGSARRG